MPRELPEPKFFASKTEKAKILARTFGASLVVALVAPGAVASATVDRALVVSSGPALFGTADDGSMLPAVNADGRYVVFHSEQGFVVPGDTNGFSDVFLRDRTNDTLEVISRTAAAQANGDSSFGDISADGRFIVFHTNSTNLAGTDTNGVWDVILFDRLTGQAEIISRAADGSQANGSSFHPSVSDDGRFVAFHSLASNLHPTDIDVDADIFLKDRTTGAVELISVSDSGGGANGRSFVPDLSGDARYVAFESESSNLVGADGNAKWDIFIRDRTGNTTERVSLSAELRDPDNNSFLPKISSDGRYVAFESFAENLIFGDTNGVADVYVYDRNLVQTTRVSVPYQTGVDSNDRSLAVSISDDGTRVTFQSWATNLVPGDVNLAMDVFLFTVGDTAPIRMSEVAGVGGNHGSGLPTISGDGSVVVFESLADNFGVAPDDDGFWDAFTYDTATRTLGAASPVGTLTASDVFDTGPFGSTGFDDVPAWAFYSEGVGFLRANGITTGTSATTYSPEAPLTRGQMVTFLFRLTGSQWTIFDEPFVDVWGGTYYYEPVKWAFVEGITTGTSATIFAPDSPVTRAQMAVFLWRLVGEPNIATPHNFDDVGAGFYYERAVRWMKDSKITTGTTDTTFSPDQTVTRAQLAAWVQRLVMDYGWTPTWTPRL